jgi:hypothetical protein
MNAAVTFFALRSAQSAVKYSALSDSLPLTPWISLVFPRAFSVPRTHSPTRPLTHTHTCALLGPSEPSLVRSFSAVYALPHSHARGSARAPYSSMPRCVLLCF